MLFDKQWNCYAIFIQNVISAFLDYCILTEPKI